MRRIVFLDVERISALHSELIDTYGGAHGLREENLLRSALDRAENVLHYVENASLPRMAAALGWGLIKNPVFIDGNKRIGLAAVLAFLNLNGMQVAASEQESKSMVLQVAASEIDEAAWTAWLERVAVPR